MFTLDPVRRIPSVVPETDDSHGAPHDRDVAPVGPLVPDGHTADQSGEPPAGAEGTAEIRRRLVQDLHEADLAIQTGRIEDAHRALIRAQDLVFDRHLALSSTNPRRNGQRSTDLFLHLTNRLIDANRFKDRTIITECRSLLDLLTETCVAAPTAPVATLT